MDGMIFAVDQRFPTKYTVETDPDTVNLTQTDYNTNVDGLAEDADVYLPLTKEATGRIYTVVCTDNDEYNATISHNSSEVSPITDILGVTPNVALAVTTEQAAVLLSLGSYWIRLGAGAITT